MTTGSPGQRHPGTLPRWGARSGRTDPLEADAMVTSWPLLSTQAITVRRDTGGRSPAWGPSEQSRCPGCGDRSPLRGGLEPGASVRLSVARWPPVLCHPRTLEAGVSPLGSVHSQVLQWGEGSVLRGEGSAEAEGSRAGQARWGGVHFLHSPSMSEAEDCPLALGGGGSLPWKAPVRLEPAPAAGDPGAHRRRSAGPRSCCRARRPSR